MIVSQLAEAMNMKLLTRCDGDQDIAGVYVCDLLSRVMSGCEEGMAWITVQTHLNVLAVAELNEAACIIIPEGIDVERTTIEKAEEKNIPILSSEMETYELCWRMHEILL